MLRKPKTKNFQNSFQYNQNLSQKDEKHPVCQELGSD